MAQKKQAKPTRRAADRTRKKSPPNNTGRGSNSEHAGHEHPLYVVGAPLFNLHAFTLVRSVLGFSPQSQKTDESYLRHALQTLEHECRTLNEKALLALRTLYGDQ